MTVSPLKLLVKVLNDVDLSTDPLGDLVSGAVPYIGPLITTLEPSVSFTFQTIFPSVLAAHTH